MIEGRLAEEDQWHLLQDVPRRVIGDHDGVEGTRIPVNRPHRSPEAMPLPGQPGRVDEEYCWPPGIRIVTREASAGAYPYQYGGPWIAVTTLSRASLTGSWGKLESLFHQKPIRPPLIR